MLNFAVAGTPLSTPKPGGTCAGMKHAAALGITAMEIEWVQMVPRSEARMQEIRQCKEELDMSLTAHAPYYINLNSEKPETIEASIERILLALRMAEIAGIHSVCVHAAFNHGMNEQLIYDRVCHSVDRIMKEKKSFPHVNLGLETMGKASQWGTLEEVIKVSKEFDIYPVVDAAHLHARYNGLINSVDEWNAMFDQYESSLGKKSLSQMHLHYSGIEYTAKGERRHLPFPESDAKWQEYLMVLKQRGIGGQFVVESPLLELETLMLQKEFRTNC